MANVFENKANYVYGFLSFLLEFGLYCPDIQIGAYIMYRVGEISAAADFIHNRDDLCPLASKFLL